MCKTLWSIEPQPGGVVRRRGSLNRFGEPRSQLITCSRKLNLSSDTYLILSDAETLRLFSAVWVPSWFFVLSILRFGTFSSSVNLFLQAPRHVPRANCAFVRLTEWCTIKYQICQPLLKQLILNPRDCRMKREAQSAVAGAWGHGKMWWRLQCIAEVRT